MKQISLKRITSIAMEAVFSFGNKESVLGHYRQAYDKLSRYFSAQSRTMFSVQLAEGALPNFYDLSFLLCASVFSLYS